MFKFNGKVVIDPLPQLPHYLQSLYDGSDVNSKHFLANLRRYNCAFQMTSFGCNEIIMPGFNPSFIIQGQVYHRIGSLCPPHRSTSHKFCQIYFMDSIASGERYLAIQQSMTPVSQKQKMLT